MKKLPTFKPTLVTKRIFPGYDDPSIINMGECFIWAYSAFLIFENVELWDVNCHAFVKYRGRFYDSVTLRGSPDWQDLPATEGATTRATKYTVDGFKFWWHNNPEKYNTTWKKIEYNARKVLRHEQAALRLRRS